MNDFYNSGQMPIHIEQMMSTQQFQIPFQPTSHQAYTPYEPIKPVSKNTIGQFLKELSDEEKIPFNDDWFIRNDDDIINSIKNIVLSCERSRYYTLKVLDFKVVKEYSEIRRAMWNYHNGKTKNGKPLDNPYDYTPLRDSSVNLLIVTYEITIHRHPDKIRLENKSKTPEKLHGIEEVYILLPKYVDKYYFKMKGNYYSAINQISDGSTYNNETSKTKAQTITLKTNFMPIKMYREFHRLTDVSSNEDLKCCVFFLYAFTKKVNAMKYILGRYGFFGALEILELRAIQVVDTPYRPDMNYNFLCADEISYVTVPKILYDNDNMTQAFIYTIVGNIHSYETLQNIYEPIFWLVNLAGDFLVGGKNVDKERILNKGIPVLDSFEFIYDITTRDMIRLPWEDKADVYRISIWIMREFSNLRLKDNLDISTKIIKTADMYINLIYAKRLSTGTYRLCDKGESIKYVDVLRVIRTSPDYILSNMLKSNLIEFREHANDDDAATALSFTYKGISGLGDSDTASKDAIPLIYRMVDPSHLGRLDLDSATASDPGLSGIVCPLSSKYGAYLSEYKEPNTWKDIYSETISTYREMVGLKAMFTIQKRLNLSYDTVKEELIDQTMNIFKGEVLQNLNAIHQDLEDPTSELYIKGYSLDPNNPIGDILIGEENV